MKIVKIISCAIISILAAQQSFAQIQKPPKNFYLCIEYSVRDDNGNEDIYYETQRSNDIYVAYIATFKGGVIKLYDNGSKVVEQSFNASNVKYKGWSEAVSYEGSRFFILFGRSHWERKLSNHLQKMGVASSGEYQMKIIPKNDPRSIYLSCS